MLASVGFGSPPAWLRPYWALSNGEKFRCDLARALLGSEGLVVFDEFTSVVDRRVAQVGSYAVSKAVRTRNMRLVAVSCHYDIADWLEPDWVVDMATCQLARGRLHRPEIRVEIRREPPRVWEVFRRHHYLSAAVPQGSKCFVAYIGGCMAAFASVSGVIGQAGLRRLSRIVVLPDFQGVGIASALRDTIAQEYAGRKLRMGITTSHPAMVRSLSASHRWRFVGEKRGRRGQRGWEGGGAMKGYARRTLSFKYVGPTVS